MLHRNDAYNANGILRMVFNFHSRSLSMHPRTSRRSDSFLLCVGSQYAMHDRSITILVLFLLIAYIN